MERHPEDRGRYQIMIEEIDRINLIADDLMFLSKPRQPMFEKVDLNSLISYVISIMKEQASNQNIQFETKDLANIPKVECDEKLMKQVFINLVKNAIESMPNGGAISISARMLHGQQVLIRVKDEGCGIVAENIGRIGDPFYTTKSDGTGLGLMVTNQIIEEHDGSIAFDSEVGKGTAVKVTIPLIQKK
jgi:signal transduction histidine kinase